MSRQFLNEQELFEREEKLIEWIFCIEGTQVQKLLICTIYSNK